MRRLLRSFLLTQGRALGLSVLALVLLAALAGALLADPSAGGFAGAATAPTAGSSLSRTADADGDTLPDIEEIARWGTDPASADGDADGLPDAWEIEHRLLAADAARPCPDPTLPDVQADCIGKGLPLAEDHRLGTDPRRADTDGDGIPDAYEATHGMDPLRADADTDPWSDGLTNAQRFLAGARADRMDTACSGMRDSEKVRLGLDPSRASTGGSGVPDGWAIHFGLDPRDPAIGLMRLDDDPQGLSVLEKALASFRLHDLCASPAQPRPDFARGLDPRKADSDEDGLPDAWETRHDLNPADPADAGGVGPRVAQRLALPEDDPRRASGAPGARQDLDGDGLSNLDAYLLGACPGRADCDGDNLTNEEEALVGWEVEVDGAKRRAWSDPLRAVSDGDRMPDAAKRDGLWQRDGKTHRFPPLDPATPDTDGDGLPDAQEVVAFAGLLDPTRKDTDGDGMPDGEEAAYWEERARATPEDADRLCARCSVLEGKPANVANSDSDGDGLADGEETRPRAHPASPTSPLRVAFPATDPASTDTDADGLPDGWEKRNARHDATLGAWDLDPSRRDSLEGLPGASRGCADEPTCSDGQRDLDEDGLANALELKAAADPHEPDTDRDGLPDGWEFYQGLGGGARHGPAPIAGKGFTWIPRAGDPVRLSPTDPTDAAQPLAKLDYVRTGRDATTLPGERVLGVSADGKESRIAGTRAWTFRDAYLWNASPARATSGSDGLPDLYKAFWSRAPAGREGTMPPDAPAAALDPDADGLANADEYRLGTSPLAPDTDLGGLLDGAERDTGLDPLDPRDDAGEGDLDGDGLTNEDELRVRRTRVDDPDTDGDGLLDGADVLLPAGPGATSDEAALREGFLARGILHAAEGARLRFRGEASLDPDPACALRWSCANDGLPDAWKLHHGLAPGFHAPTGTNSADGLGVLEEYRWGRPANWSEEEHGTWWLGLDPTRADTRRDGTRDDALVAMRALADLDGDGLHDLTGEDPTPFHGPLDVWDRGALLQARLARDAAPPASATRPTPATLTLDAAPPATLAKGGWFEVAGRLRAQDGSAPGRPVPVLARLVPAEAEEDGLGLRASGPEDVLGVGFTDASGSFRLRVDVMKEHVVPVPPGVHALFSETPSAEARWDATTAGLRPGAPYRVVVWSYGTPRIADVLAGAAWVSGPIPLASNATWLAPNEALLTPGAATLVNVTLADGAGDPHTPARAGLASLSTGGSVFAPVAIRGANLTFEVRLPEEAPATPVAARLLYQGDAALQPGEAGLLLVPRLATRLTLRALAGEAVLGDALALEGRLLDARGTPLADATVALRLAGATATATTRGDGSFDARLTLPAFAGLGAQAPGASYAGGRHHEPASAQAPAVTVLAQPAFVNVTTSLELGKGGDVRGRLLAAGAPVLDPFTSSPPAVRIRVGAHEATATPDKEGRFRVLVPASEAAHPGLVHLELSSAPSPLVRAATASLDVALASATVLTVEPAQATRGEAAALTGRLADATGQPLGGALVQAKLDGAEAEARSLPNGSFTLLLPTPREGQGTASATVSFPGLPPVHGPSNATVEIRLLPGVRVELAQSVLDAADPVVRGRLARDDGAPLAGRALEALVDRGAPRAFLTREDGTFSFPLTLDEAARPSLAVHFRAPARGGLGALSQDEVVLVDRGARIHLAVEPSEVKPGGSFGLRLRLEDETGRALVASVRILLAGRDVANLTTDAKGDAAFTLRVPASAPLGPTLVQAIYAGQSGIRPAQASTTAHVREPPRVEATLHAPQEPGAPWEAVLALRDRDGAGLPGESVFLALPAGDLLRVETDEEGRAVVLLADAPANVTVVFAGSPSHQPLVQAAAVVSAQPVPSAPSAWGNALALAALAGALALPLVVGTLLLRHRRRARRSLDEAFARAESGFRASDRHGQAVLDAYRALVDALALHRLADAATATPRETQAALCEAFGLPEDDLETVVQAFERLRYAQDAFTAEDAARVVDSLGRLRVALKEGAR